MKEQKYPNGYLPKIEYYTDKLNEAIENLNTESVKFFTKKLTYFMEKQKEISPETQWNKFYL